MLFYVRDHFSFERLHVIDTFESAIWTKRYYDCGDFEIYMPASPEALDIFREDRWVELDGDNELMLIEKIQVDTNVELGSHITVSGRSASSLIDRRVVWGYRSYTDANVQEALIGLVNDSLVSPSNSDRKIEYMRTAVSTDPKVVDHMFNHDYLGDNLLDVMKNVCFSVGLGFRSLYDEMTNTITFELYSGENRSYTQDTLPYVVFSPSYENLKNSQLVSSSESYRNVALIGGEGTASAKILATTSVGGTHIGPDRREKYTDASSVTKKDGDRERSDEEVASLMVDHGKTDLYNCPRDIMFDGETIPEKMFVYGKDYSIGDIVQIENEYGMRGNLRIVEFIQTQDSTGYRAYPTFS